MRRSGRQRMRSKPTEAAALLDARIRLSPTALLLAATTVAVLLACTEPARCDFLSDLFGTRQAAPEAPALTITRGRPSSRVPRRKPARSRSEARVETPAIQRTRDILDDATLRDGDALMAMDGIRIYSGGRSAKHTASQFVPLGSAAHVNKEARSLLLAINDARRRHPGSAATAHFAGAKPLSTLRATTGPQTVTRYVGP